MILKNQEDHSSQTIDTLRIRKIIHSLKLWISIIMIHQ